MNKKTVKAVSRRILKTMMADEKSLRVLLETETDGVPEEQLVAFDDKFSYVDVHLMKHCFSE